jgi:hypothetical protein
MIRYLPLFIEVTTLDLRLKELPPEPWDVTPIPKCINKLSFLEVVDYNDAPQQFE